MKTLVAALAALGALATLSAPASAGWFDRSYRPSYPVYRPAPAPTPYKPVYAPRPYTRGY
jgi:hypothetical protein